MQPSQHSHEDSEEAELVNRVPEFFDRCTETTGRLGEMVELSSSEYSLPGIPDVREVDLRTGTERLDFDTVASLRSRFLIGTGNQLKLSWEQLVRESGMEAFPKQERIGDRLLELHWQRIRDLVFQFFDGAGERPAQIWFHPLVFLNETILEVRDYQRIPPHQSDPIREHSLREPTLLFRDRGTFPPIAVPVGLQWQLPDGCDDDDVWIASIPSDHFYSGKQSWQWITWHSERFSPIPRGAVDRSINDRYLFGHDHLAYVASWDQARNRSILSRLNPSDLPASLTAIMLDSYVMKLWRLDQDKVGDIEGESLVLAFDRKEGRLAYLKRNQGPYRLQSGELLKWLNRK